MSTKSEPKHTTLRRRILSLLPWVITAVALYYAFRDVDWGVLSDHLGDADPLWIGAAVLLTSFSYVLRAKRWQYLFPKTERPILSFGDSYRVLILGFFMNNLLPARTGEFVRAHMGARRSGESRTLVLATIASERLVDGLVLSVMFVAFALHGGSEVVSQRLLWVAYFFGAVTLGVLVTLAFRTKVFALIERLAARFTHRASHYTLQRIRIFIEGLSPLSSCAGIPRIAAWSALIWGVELTVYYCITRGFDAPLPLGYCVLFLVTVNFSSLIPAAPGGIGVIELAAKSVLVSLGVPGAKALTMVLVQHITQILVVGIPGALVMLSWKQYSWKGVRERGDELSA